MQDNNSHHDSKFFSGFLIGLILGAAIVFLIGTKKGKKILKTISEEGLEGIANTLQEMEDEEMVDQDFVEDIPEPVKPKEEVESSEPEVVVKKPRRFFKKKN
jgi:hypothetical protein